MQNKNVDMKSVDDLQVLQSLFATSPHISIDSEFTEAEQVYTTPMPSCQGFAEEAQANAVKHIFIAELRNTKIVKHERDPETLTKDQQRVPDVHITAYYPERETCPIRTGVVQWLMGNAAPHSAQS